MPSFELGESIPADTAHAVSVSLPTWKANVGYEEGETSVISKMASGYPRFFIHKTILAFANDIVRQHGRLGQTAILLRMIPKSERQLRSGERYLALFCEFPGNPLLACPDLQRIRQLANEFDFFVVIDETIGTFANINVLQFADIVVSSLTKIFSGDCNVMGGCAILNPTSIHYTTLKAAMESGFEDTYWPEDVVFLERNSRDFLSRVGRINSNSEAICEILRAHPLGTNFTLTCPYVLIAHYQELEWAAKFGAETTLIRVSVGLEETEALLKVFEEALHAASAVSSSILYEE
ncbi:unnamed protein product [Parascedosporium putredinis]|uniref:Cystathionine gamma-synthase n=1 Tax=Parascedosporium putredinis TaxID=1442378 RepID=A0A9P1H3C1_9PEZI|nr:unnamed protein product [Parascedosporium putredinis]CAI7994589.1 unnamed protein product [Parascedosporium putredinis]